MNSPGRRLHAGLVLLGALFGGAACGGGPSFDGRVYHGGDLSFRVGPVPAEWRAIEATEALFAFRDDRARATIAVNGRCGKDADDVPLEALTQHLFLYFTDRAQAAQQRFQLDGRAALRTELSAQLDGVQKHFVVVVVKKDGCVYDFIQIADQPPSPAAREAFDGFVTGFATSS